MNDHPHLKPGVVLRYKSDPDREIVRVMRTAKDSESFRDVIYIRGTWGAGRINVVALKADYEIEDREDVLREVA
jgi:hypothetical protein